MSETNSRKSLLPIFIYDILKENTDKDHHISQEKVRKLLYEQDRIQVERKAVGRQINELVGEDFNVFGNAREGYWYDRWGYFAG